MYEGMQTGDRVRITHTTGITESATVDSIIHRGVPALYVTYADGTTGRVDGGARVERLGTTTGQVTIEAPSVAAFASVLAELDHETRAVVTATENGKPWAHVEVTPMTDTYRAVFPVDWRGVRGDTSKRGQAGVMATGRDGWASLPLVIERARRMARTVPACPRCGGIGAHGLTHVRHDNGGGHNRPCNWPESASA